MCKGTIHFLHSVLAIFHKLQYFYYAYILQAVEGFILSGESSAKTHDPPR